MCTAPGNRWHSSVAITADCGLPEPNPDSLLAKLFLVNTIKYRFVNKLKKITFIIIFIFFIAKHIFIFIYI